MNEKYAEWIKSLKVDDEVIVQSSGELVLATVERLTNTQVVVRHLKYWRNKNDIGCLVGWGVTHRKLLMPTPELKREMSFRAEAKYLEGIYWSMLPADLVIRIADEVKQEKARNAKSDTEKP